MLYMRTKIACWTLKRAGNCIGFLWKFRQSSDNFRKRSSSPRNNFGKSSKIFRKRLEIFGKSSKTSLLVCLYKQIITCPLLDMNFIFSCSTRYLTLRCAHSLCIERTLEERIHIHAGACNILYVLNVKVAP